MASTVLADVLVRLHLTQTVANAYELQATALNIPLESLLESRLAQFVSLSDAKPLYFTDEDRRDLEALLGKNVSTPIEVLRLLRTYHSVRISGKPDLNVRVDLKPNLLSRLRSRCFGKSFDDFLKSTIITELERFAGLR